MRDSGALSPSMRPKSIDSDMARFLQCGMENRALAGIGAEMYRLCYSTGDEPCIRVVFEQQRGM
jgi:hypothetical protein